MRETSRSFERLTERMAEMAANEASLQCKVHALQAEKEEALDEKNNVIAVRDAEFAELKQTTACTVAEGQTVSGEEPREPNTP